MNAATVRLRYLTGTCYIFALFACWLYFNRIEAATRLNTAVLTRHSEQLANHDTQLALIFENKFSPGFLSIIKKDFDERR